MSSAVLAATPASRVCASTPRLMSGARIAAYGASIHGRSGWCLTSTASPCSRQRPSTSTSERKPWLPAPSTSETVPGAHGSAPRQVASDLCAEAGRRHAQLDFEAAAAVDCCGQRRQRFALSRRHDAQASVLDERSQDEARGRPQARLVHSLQFHLLGDPIACGRPFVLCKFGKDLARHVRPLRLGGRGPRRLGVAKGAQGHRFRLGAHGFELGSGRFSVFRGWASSENRLRGDTRGTGDMEAKPFPVR
eukprot:scaffold74194_cov66-Phaeocystis_antarctica.AAC.5